MPFRRAPAFVAVLLACAAPAAAATWPEPVPGWTAPQADEHPRLFFRSSEVPAIRARAATVEGRAIVARLRATLGGGEAVPTATTGLGSYTLWHGAGFGMLYQLTGDTRYADLGRQAVQLAFDGTPDRDTRYSWTVPGGALRAGPSLSAIAMAYDLCFGGWDPAFRADVALRIQNYAGNPVDGNTTLFEMATSPRHFPGSNHWGAQVGGAGIAVLAIAGDTGTNASLLATYRSAIEANIMRNLTEGFGDGGYFWEHEGPGGISSDTAFVPCLQAMRVAGGTDFVTPAPNAPMISLIHVMELIPKYETGSPYQPLRHPGAYGTEDFSRDGLSRAGQFSQGFGAVASEAQKAAMLWTYRNVVEPNESIDFPQWLSPGEQSYDGMDYPHRPMLALVNWPIGAAPVNPADVMPRVSQDSIHRYYVFRNRWQDRKDSIVTALFGARNDGIEDLMVWSLGIRTVFGTCVKAATAAFQPLPDGSGVVSSSGGASTAVDYSGLSGAEALIVRVGPGAALGGDATGPEGASATSRMVSAGGTDFYVMTVQSGAAPAAVASGAGVLIGGRLVTFDGTRLVLGVPPPVVGSLQFASAAGTVAEGAGTATLTVTRSGGSAGAVSVSYATVDGSAVAGADYTAIGGTLTWADGDGAPKTIAVPIAGDGIGEQPETLSVLLSAPTGGASLGTLASSVLTIADDDFGTLQLGAATYAIGEAGGSVTIAVTRSDGGGGAVGVSYATVAGTAEAGTDFTAVGGTLSWAAGDGATKTITVPIVDGAAGEVAETFAVILSSPTGGAALGAPASATVTIADDDGGTLQFQAAAIEVGEGGGTATITVARSGGSAAVGLSYATADGTATAGADYSARSGTLSWAAGDLAPKTFTVPITQDALLEPGETLTLTLSAPTGGAVLGATTQATLTIADDDALQVQIDFGPAASAVEPGYLRDAGLKFAARGALSYGWSVDVSSTARDRDSAITMSPVQAHDTFVAMKKGSQLATWELAVPNGAYEVFVSCGDPAAVDSVYKVHVEGVLVVNGAPNTATPAGRWVEGGATVTVADGRLTVANAVGAVNNKLCFIHVVRVPTAAQ